MNYARANLFESLGRWASAQQENFLTECFARFLEVLRDESPNEFVDLISTVTSARLTVDPVLTPDVTISTQVAADHSNYPDLETRGPGFLIWVEVKDQSPLDVDQLARYSALLQRETAPAKALVFLSRSIATLPNLPLLVPPMGWSRIADWLTRYTTSVDGNSDSTVAFYLARELYGFLKEKGMAIEKVGWEILPGIVSLRDLRTMLAETLQGLIAHKIWAAGSHVYTGWGIYGPESANRTISYLFVNFDYPDEIRFTVRNEYLPESNRAGWEDHDRDSKRRVLNMAKEDVHFFALSVSSQRRILHEFVENCLRETNIPIRATGEALAEIEMVAEEDA